MLSCNFLERNLSFFPASFQKKILAFKSNTASEITLQKAKTGDIVPTCRGKFIHSKYDPVKEAQTFCRQYADADCESIVVFGFGFGYHVEELRRLKPDREIIVFELLPELLYEALKARDFSGLFEKGRISLIAEKQIQEFAAAFQRTDSEVIQEKKCQIVIYAPAVNTAPPAFQEVVNALELIEMGRKQPRAFNRIETQNLYENAGIISRSKGIAPLRNRCSGLPALIVGAGPSLDNTLPYLVQHQEKFIIIAVDAAMTALMNDGIKPDFIVTIDPQAAVFHHLASHLEETVPMFATPIAYHRLLEKYRGEKIFLSQDNSSFCKEIPLLEELGTTKAGSSVSCFAIDIALQLGCSSLFLTGVDSSFPSMMAYAKKTLLHAGSSEYILRRKLVFTDDLFGGEVATHQNLYEYLRTIEAQIADSQASFFLVGGIGARIKGAEPINQSHAGALVNVPLKKKSLLSGFLQPSLEKNQKLYKNIREVATRGLKTCP